MKTEVVILGSPSLISLMVSVKVKQHRSKPNLFITEPRSGLNREVELGCHSEFDSSLLQVSTAGSLGTHCLCDCVPRNC